MVVSAPKTLSLSGQIPSDFALIGSSYMIIGNPSQNKFNGSVNVYSATNFTKVLQIDGVNNGANFGTNLAVSHMTSSSFDFAVTESRSSRYQDVDVVRVLVNSTTGALSATVIP